jgi:glycerophosphoryl diester phosphodiesterase
MLVNAHRGASGYAPENTFAAFDLARQVGADGVETDVRLTRDGALVLLHDATLDRTTDGSGPIGRRAWAEVERLDAGRWFGPEFAGQRVPRLDAFLDRYLGPVTQPLAQSPPLSSPRGWESVQGEGRPPDVFRLCLEVKTPRVVEPLVRLLRERGLAAHEDLEVTSFSRAVVREARETLPKLAVGQITYFFFSAIIDRAARDGASHVWPRASALTVDRVARAHALGLGVWAWGIRDRSLLRRATEAGVDALVLDYPDWAR